jgi:hypothetical protein
MLLPECPVTDRSAHNVALAWAGLIGWQTIGVLVVVQVGPWSCSPGILPVDPAQSGFAKSCNADGDGRVSVIV